MSRHKWDPVCAPATGLVRPVGRDPSGQNGPTKGQAAGPNWRRTSQGYYVPAAVDGTRPEQRVMEQSVRLPAGGAVTGWASCRLHRANFFDGLEADGITRMPVPLALGATGSIRRDPAVCLSRERLDADEVAFRYGVPCTCPRRALFDEIRRLGDLREAVVAMDMMAAARLVSIARMRAYVSTRSGWNGSPGVVRALGLASERSKSPNETRMRLIWELDAGFPRPLVNQPVRDLAGNLLGIADIFDPVAGVVGEFDGADHRSAARHSKDVDREARFRDNRLEFFRVTGSDLRHWRRVVDRMVATRARALWVPEGRRTWTIAPRVDSRDDPTLDEYLEHRAWEISLYEQHQREGDPDVRDLIDL